MAVTLSILIATMPKRKWKLQRLMAILTPQLNNNVEVILDDSMEYNIGVKRNKLLQRANGEWVVFQDDDDSISCDYVEKILKALESNPDCVGISGKITTNGKNAKQWHISKEYGRWHEEKGEYLRTPNHISPVRREIALKCMFPEIAYGEDAVYSERILPHLKTEAKVEGDIYFYQYRTKK